MTRDEEHVRSRVVASDIVLIQGRVPTLTHLIVLDFEATCDDAAPPSPQEIIEFPSVMLDASTLDVVDEFESFVRPVHHPKLTRFCTELTGITQADVDAAPTFPEVLDAHLAWLRSHGLPVELDDPFTPVGSSSHEGGGASDELAEALALGVGSSSRGDRSDELTDPLAPGVVPSSRDSAYDEPETLPYAIVTCGDWDLQTMLPAQLCASDPPFHRVPPPYRRWINVKVPFKAWQPRKGAAGMARMLELLGLELEGRHHRGIDDCRNIAKIVRALVARRQVMQPTTELSLARHPPLDLHLERDGETRPLRLEKRAISTLLGAASDAFRRQATRVALSDRPLTKDSELFDLQPGVTLRVD